MINIVAGINSQDSSPKDGLLGWIRARRTRMAIERRVKLRSWVQLYEQCQRMLSRLDVTGIPYDGMTFSDDCIASRCF